MKKKRQEYGKKGKDYWIRERPVLQACCCVVRRSQPHFRDAPSSRLASGPNQARLLRLFMRCLLGILLAAPVERVRAGDADKPAHIASPALDKSLADALPPEKWRQVEDSVDRALAWIASRQNQGRSFPTSPVGQQSGDQLCILAFLSGGHQPGLGPYGAQLNRAIDFVLECQMADGLFSYQIPEARHVDQHASHTATSTMPLPG